MSGTVLNQQRTVVRAEHARPVETHYRPARVLDLGQTLGVLQRGRNDPTMLTIGAVIWRTWLTDAGVATVALRQRSDEVLAAAWGPGAAEALDAVPAMCGADDDDAAFDPSHHPLIAASHHRHPGLRLAAAPPLAAAVVSAVLEQKVTGIQAFGAWRSLVTKYGLRAPGPTPRPMYAAPALSSWRTIPSWAWHRAGVEPPQARTIVRFAARGDALTPAIDAADAGERDRLLTAQPGIGAWTSAEVRIRAYGDADAVSVGDYHLAHQVGYALTGSRVDDDGMVELLEPWRGQRQRVIRLIWASGVAEPRRGPRLHPENHRNR